MIEFKTIFSSEITEKDIDEVITYCESLKKDIRRQYNSGAVLLKRAIRSLSNKWKWDIEKVKSYLEKLLTLDEFAFRHILLKELAIVMDSEYEDHILDCCSVCVISRITGSPIFISTDDIVYLDNVACFRDENSALLANKIVWKCATSIRKSYEQKSKECQEKSVQ